METSAIVTPSVARVPLHTATEVNQRIREETTQRLAYYREHPEQIGRRIKALNEEWDIERALATGLVVPLAPRAGARSRARTDGGSLLTAGVQSFYLQHSLQGWCPPLPMLRRLGFPDADGDRAGARWVEGDPRGRDGESRAARRTRVRSQARPAPPRGGSLTQRGR